MELARVSKHRVRLCSEAGAAVYHLVLGIRSCIPRVVKDIAAILIRMRTVLNERGVWEREREVGVIGPHAGRDNVLVRRHRKRPYEAAWKSVRRWLDAELDLDTIAPRWTSPRYTSRGALCTRNGSGRLGDREVRVRRIGELD